MSESSRNGIVLPSAVHAVDLLECCKTSLAAQIELDEVIDKAQCEFSYGADLHRLIKIGTEWRRLVLLLLALFAAGCTCPFPGHRGITPDECALRSEAACRQECSELTTSGTAWQPGPANQPWQQFAGFERGEFCACFDTALGTFSGTAVGNNMSKIEAAWKSPGGGLK